MKKTIIMLSALVFTISAATAQENPKVKKSDFVTSASQDGTQAWKNAKKATRKYRHHEKGYYQEALPLFQKASEYNEDNAAILYKTGISELKCSQNASALKHLQAAYDQNSNVTTDILYWLAVAKQRNNLFAKAKDDYNEYLDALDTKKREKVNEDVQRKIQECENGIALLKKPKLALRQKIEGSLNTTAPEYSPLFSNLDSAIYITSRRSKKEGNSSNKKSLTNHQYFEDIYASHPENGKYGEAKNAGKRLNTKLNDASVTINTSGQQMVVYRGKKGRGNLYVSVNKNGTWKRNEKVVAKINKKKDKETAFTFSSDSSLIYFASDRKKGLGGFDIWYCQRKPNGKRYGKPINLGAPINTPYDEDCPSFGSGDTVLYFASNNEKSVGGFDIFKASSDGNAWKEPVNLGLGVNSGDDEKFFNIVPGSTRIAYYASKNAESVGDYDIYKSLILTNIKKPLPALPIPAACVYAQEPALPLESPEVIKTMRLTVIDGTITDFEGEKNLPAKIEIYDTQTNEIIQTVNTDPSTGKYTVMLPSGKNYGMSVQSDGYFFHSENFNIPSTKGYQQIQKDIRLLSMDPGSKVVLNNVFFDSGKSNLRPESYGELNRLAEVFKLYEHLVVEISGHTDNSGSRATNQRLSLARAKAVVDYLVSIGVPQSRLIAKGYGPDQPRDTNRTAEGRQNNRRVEAKIISK